VIEGEGAIHPARAKSSRGLVIEITDETGKPVDGAAVSFRLPEEGPGATFVRGMRTEIAITTPDGRASFHELLTGTTPGPFQIRVTAVKDSIRAGTVVDQYISDAPVKGSGSKSMVSGKGSRKWMLWAAVAGGAAAAAVVAGMSGGSGGSPSTPAAPSTPPTIGAPSVSVGRPQ